MTKYEVKLTAEQLKDVWAKVGMDDPYGDYSNSDDIFWEFLYLTERCPEVLKEEYHSLTCDNEDANEILNKMSNFWRGIVFENYAARHSAEVREAFNIWWWSNHDVTDYEEE